MEIYRIENFTPTPVEEQFWGEFYDGDSYVCIYKGKKMYDIHYWEGKNSTADETGCAAAFTVQLSDRFMDNFNMEARHHLELMEEESELFLSRFPKGIKYMQGGCDSGFKHYVPEEHVPQLMRVFGKRYPRIFSMPLKGSSLNEGDVFILDLGDKIYNWQGKDSNQFEQMAAICYCGDLKNHMRKAQANIYFPRDEGNAAENDAFWAALEGSEADVQPANAKEDEQTADEDEMAKYRLWHCHEEDNQIKVDEI